MVREASRRQRDIGRPCSDSSRSIVTDVTGVAPTMPCVAPPSWPCPASSGPGEAAATSDSVTCGHDDGGGCGDNGRQWSPCSTLRQRDGSEEDPLPPTLALARQTEFTSSIRSGDARLTPGLLHCVGRDEILSGIFFMANSADSILSRIKDEEIDWVDLRFTDPKGKWQHLTMASGVIDEDMLTDGFMFDGSSIAGWKAINESDMILKPDLDAAYVDPFSATPMMVLFCNVVEPSTGELYGRDPRSTATRAEAYLKADRHRRHRLRRSGSRILHVRRCPLRGHVQRQRLQDRRHRAADQHDARI